MLIDTNVIIYAINTRSPKHERAKQFLIQAKNDLVVADQNILEAIRVLTHDKFSHPMTLVQAEKAVDAIARASRIITPSYETLPVALMLMYKYSRSSNRIFDAYLVATMLTHTVVEIATDNERDFVVYKEIRVINPFRSGSSRH